MSASAALSGVILDGLPTQTAAGARTLCQQPDARDALWCIEWLPTDRVGFASLIPVTQLQVATRCFLDGFRVPIDDTGQVVTSGARVQGHVTAIRLEKTNP